MALRLFLLVVVNIHLLQSIFIIGTTSSINIHIKTFNMKTGFTIMKNAFKVLLLLAFLLAGSCSSDKPTDPYEGATDWQSLYLDLFDATDYDNTDVCVADSAEMEINLAPDSGDSSLISIDSDDIYVISGDSTVIEDVQVSIGCRKLRFIQGADSSKSALVFTCLPDSLEFNDELVIDVPADAFSNHPHSNAIKLLLYNPNSNRWHVVEIGHKSNPRIQFGIYHFSRYAISD